MKKNILLSFLAMTVIFFIGISHVKAQLSGSSAFMQGQFVEVGISGCGVYGSNDALPTGPHGAYHPNVFAGLGFVVDSGKDGWDVGTPNYCGDYFTPGSPEEGWSIQYGDSVYENHQPGCYGYGGEIWGAANIVGSITSYTDTLSVKQVIWEGGITSGDLNISISQTTTLPDTALYYTTEYKVTNAGTDTLHNLYLTINIDPDQDQPWSSDYATTNTIISNPPANDTAWVTAAGLTYGCFFSMSAIDPNARVSYGNFGLAPNTPEQAWNGDAGAGYSNSGSVDCDCAVQLTYKLTVAPGETASASSARSFIPSAVEQAMNYIEFMHTDTTTEDTTVVNPDAIVSINENKFFSIYPNPAVDGFTVNIHAAINDDLKLEITNTNGNLILTSSVTNTKQYINTEDLSAGLYLIKIVTADKIYLKSLIIQ